MSNHFKLEYDIVNVSNEPIHVKAKGGIGYRIKAMKEVVSYGEQYVIVQLKAVDYESLKINSNNSLSKFDKVLLSKLEERFNSLKEEETSKIWGFNKGDVIVTIYLEDNLKEYNEGIHSEILGITLYQGDKFYAEDALGTPGETIETLRENHNWEGLGSCVVINDVEGVCDPLYCNLLGKTYRVPVVKNKGRHDGLYYLKPTTKGLTGGSYYSFDQLDDKLLQELGLYKSKNDAARGEVAENVNRLMKEKKDLTIELDKSYSNNKRLELELTKQQNELSTIKAQHRIEITSLKSTLDILKQENKVKEISTKNQLEVTRSRLENNNVGELVKVLTLLGGLGLGAYKAYKNWS